MRWNTQFARRLSPIVLFSVVFLCISGCVRPRYQTKTYPPIDRQSLVPPTARTSPKADTLHGDIRIDNYFWLRERSNPEVTRYLQDENKYTEAMMKHTEKFQERLYKELLGRIKETDLSVPYKLDDYYYYSRTEEGKQYSIYCRKKGTLEAEEEILLDQNELAAGHEYLELGVYRVSPDHKFLAYSVDTVGSERYTLYVKDLERDALFEEEIPNTGYTLAWANDNKTIFYTVEDEASRPYRLYRHTLGNDPRKDFLVYQEMDDAMFLYVSRTKSEKYILMELGSHTTTEVRALNANEPTKNFGIIHPRQSEIEYYVRHHGDRFFILTNDQAKNFRLMEAPTADPSRKNWSEVIPHRDSVKIDAVDAFKDHLVVFERKDGLKRIRVINLPSGQDHYVDFPEPVYTFWRGKNPEFESTKLRFTYTSLVTPRSIFDYDMDTRSRELKKQYEVLGGYDASLFQSERIFARAKDRTTIPISLVYRKGILKDGGNPLLLTGYGSYGSSSEPYFSSNRLSLLNRGFIYAIAHVRGGGEMGRYWYEEGKLLNKMNTFTDFIVCAEHLVAQGYTSKEELVISGGSAGGLLIGAVTNMRPDLFKGVVGGVPFVDVLNTMLDPSLPLTVLEYEEWGNPNEKTYYHYIKSYSPYDNVEAKNYPNMLVTAGLNDTRVSYWEAAKWVARLRASKTDSNVLLLKTKMGAGHGGWSGRYDYLKDIAFEYAFILDLFDIRK